MLIILVFTTALSFAQVRKYSNEFLAIGVGAKAFGMGNSVVASVDDVTAGFWNPAGLVEIKSKFQVGLMHAEYFAGVSKFDYGAIAVPLDSNKHALAFSVIRFATDDIPNTLRALQPDGTFDYDAVTSFSAVDFALITSYSREILKNFNVGANIKVVRRKAGSFARAWGFGLDVGAQYHHKDWKFGVMIRDITTTFNAWTFSFDEFEREVLFREGNIVPRSSQEITVPKIIIGAAYHRVFNQFEFKAEIDIDINTDGKRNVLISASPMSFDPHFGVEAGFAEIIYARFGLSNIQKVPDQNGETSISVQPNLGVGIRFREIYIDYAYTDVGGVSEASFSHIVSLKAGFNKKKAK